ncbi:MAG: hypothetical protein ACYC2P_08680 [Paludibacteraceae bacterium]
MIVRKQYIPKRHRNKKLVNTSASGGFIAGSSNSTFIPEHKELRGLVTITDILNEGATDIHLTKTVAESLLTTIENFNNWFEWDNTGTAIKAKYDFYSVGEVSAFGAGTGVSGLTLQGDMNANGKNITNLLSVSNQQSMITMGYDSISFDILGGNILMINNAGVYANTNIEASGTAQATEFKFGLWTFMQDGSGRLGIYNGLTEVACFNTDGTYVKL